MLHVNTISINPYPPYFNILQFHKGFKINAEWLANIWTSHEIVGFSSKYKDAIILKTSTRCLMELTFKTNPIDKEWILVKIEDVYQHVELCFRNKSESELILMRTPWFANCIDNNQNDIFFLINQKSIQTIISFSFKDILSLNLTNWTRLDIRFDETVFKLGLNKIREFWENLWEDWEINIFLSKSVLEKVCDNYNFWKAIKSYPINRIFIDEIGTIEISESSIIVSLTSDSIKFWLTRDMQIIHEKNRKETE